eukprot:SAG31_NODE_9923_length_1209_cov_1.507207_2_plen_173_part_00
MGPGASFGWRQACRVSQCSSPLAVTAAVPPLKGGLSPAALKASSARKDTERSVYTHGRLVVSHGCGFNTFPSRTAFPEFDFVYNYSVASSPWKGGKGDIAKEFVEACHKHGIRPGFYHGSVNNAFLNLRGGKVGKPTGIPGQAIVTQEQYYKILLANLRQLWTDYGPLAEVR